MKTASRETWTVRTILGWTAGFLEQRGSATGRLDAELLLARVLGCDRLRLFLDHDRPLLDGERDRFRELVRLRAEGRPVAYLLGEREFYSLRLAVDDRVLIPRPETEHLVDVALEWLARLAEQGRGRPRVLEVGTGSGCVAVALARQHAAVRVVATDLSRSALEVARANVAACGVGDRVRLLAADALEPFAGAGLEGRTGGFDLIVSNPPYVATSEREALPRDVREHEPPEALQGGPEGLDLYRRLAAGARRVLAAGGAVIVELGAGRRPQVERLFREAGFASSQVTRDYARVERVLTAREGG
ncbi:MAG: peptide chain release factor N(5)-glutamine methyltransferase [Planctomycetes bacterium]|nr:peptide chain release factor N(5)-glutamine methyltransferase [Planctomycetota bacterium]